MKEGKTNKPELTVKLISVLVALSVVICCMSFAFVDVSAVTVNDKATGSAIAGSVVRGDGLLGTMQRFTLCLTVSQKRQHINDHSYGRTLSRAGSRFPAGTLLRAHSVTCRYYRLSRRLFQRPRRKLHCGFPLRMSRLTDTAASGNGHFAHYSYHGYYVLDYANRRKLRYTWEFETLI